MTYEIAAHHVEPQAIVSIRDRRKQDDLPAFIKAAFPDLLGRLRLLGVRPSGPPFVIYHQFGADGIDAEVAIPIDASVTATSLAPEGSTPASHHNCPLGEVWE